MAITDPLCRSFLDLWWHFDPAAATQAGVPGYDGRLGAFDPDSLRAHLAAFRSIAAAVEELDVEETADEIDRTALLDRLRVLLFRFEREHPWQTNPVLWLEHAISAFEALPPTAAALERVRALPGFLEALPRALRKPPVFLVETALAQLPALSGLLDETGERFEPAWSREVEGEGDVAAAMTDAKAALEQLENGLRQLPANPDPYGVAIGEDEVNRRLHHEHASIHNAAEIWRGALRQAAETEQEVSALAAALDPARPWRDVYASLREAHPSPVWSELSEEALDALEASTRFAETQGLDAGAPPLAVEQLSAASQVLEPIARYRPAGAFHPAALQLGDPDRPMVPWLAVRLGVPGMHLHRTRRDLLPGLVRRYIAAPSTPLGWSLYAAELLAELGYRDDPETRLVERVLFLHDVHLAIVDLGLHTRQLSAAEAVAHLVGQLGLDRANAVTEVRRLACRPTTACAALLGWQELRRLHHDLKALRGPEFRLEDFHQGLFSYGGLPVPLIRWGMGLVA